MAPCSCCSAVYITRYLDVFQNFETENYLFFFKVAYILLTASMIAAFSLHAHTYDQAGDSCNVVLILVPVAILAFLVSEPGGGAKQMCWTFSEVLEPVALLPQYIMSYRSLQKAKLRRVVVLFLTTVGGYRFLYVCSWIYKRMAWHTLYTDPISWLGGCLECAMFTDFAFTLSQGSGIVSSFGSLMLQADDKAVEWFEQVELNALGRKVPFGLSGASAGETPWKESDKIGEEERDGLLSDKV